MMYNPDHMSKFIHNRRKELGLSLDQVAALAGTTKSHIWELEKGRSKNPTTKCLFLCAAHCNAA